eukprot:GHUV01038586.1.p1 GENE.GHUV01038586.1~~GHUV01038586.1.p1  ORF type:complete len:134 (-),score=29.53 GHUV01038586.1:70-471(-)
MPSNMLTVDIVAHVLCMTCRWSEDAVIIPVNTTVGRSGSVLVTFKSTNSVPPLRIENRTKSVTVMLRQHLDATKSPAVAGSIGTLRPSAMPSRKETSPRCLSTDITAVLLCWKVLVVWLVPADPLYCPCVVLV